MAKYYIQIVAYVDVANEQEAQHAADVIVQKLREDTTDCIRPGEDCWVESVEKDTDIGEVK